MRAIRLENIPTYLCVLTCACGRSKEFYIGEHGRGYGCYLSKKDAETGIPGKGWNGWDTTRGKERCPICVLASLDVRSKKAAGKSRGTRASGATPRS